MEPQLLFFLFIPVVIAFVIYGFIQAKKRRDELRKWAHANGLAFSSSHDRSMDNHYPEFSCLRKGHSRYAYNVITGPFQDYPVCLFDYHFATGSGKNKSDHHFSAAIIETSLPMKPLFIRTENIFDKFTEFVGFDDIDFESADFSREFYVKSPDKKWAYDVLHQKTMEFLLGAPRFTLDFQGSRVMAYRSSRFTTSDFEDAMAVVKGIIGLMPDSLIQELKGELS